MATSVRYFVATYFVRFCVSSQISLNAKDSDAHELPVGKLPCRRILNFSMKLTDSVILSFWSQVLAINSHTLTRVQATSISHSSLKAHCKA
jgi:hypothetical protein